MYIYTQCIKFLNRRVSPEPLASNRNFCFGCPRVVRLWRKVSHTFSYHLFQN